MIQMFTVLTILIVAFLVYVGGGNGEWGVVAIAVVIGGIVLIGLSGLRSGSRAVNNWVDYWSRGGPNGNRRHKSGRRW